MNRRQGQRLIDECGRFHSRIARTASGNAPHDAAQLDLRQTLVVRYNKRAARKKAWSD